MNQFSEWFVSALIRSTLWMSITAGLVLCVLKFTRLQHPRTEQRLWLLVLFQGVLFFPLQISLPILPSVPHAVTESKSSPIENPFEVEEENLEAENLASVPLDGKIPDSKIVAAKQTVSPVNGTSGDIQRMKFPQMTWKSLFVSLWSVGILTLIAFGTRRYLQWLRITEQTEQINPVWIEEWGALLQSKGVKQSIPLQGVLSAGPALVWSRRGYRVIVPTSEWNSIESRHRRAILDHELSHYLRGHLWTALLARLLMLIHWYNPVAWWILAQFEQQTEFECDEAASETESTPLAEGLMKLGRSLPSMEPVLVHQVTGGKLYERVRRLLSQRERSPLWKCYASLAIGFLTIILAQFPIKPIPAEISQPEAIASSSNEVTEKKEKEVLSETKPENSAEQWKPRPLYHLGSELYRSEQAITQLEISSDGRFIIAGSGVSAGFIPMVQVFETLSGKILRKMIHPESEGKKLLSLAVSPDDQFILAGENEGWLTIWNLQTGETVTRFQACESDITRILFTPAKNQFVCIGWDRKLFLRDLINPEAVAQEFVATDSEKTGLIDFASAYCANFTDDGKRLCVISHTPETSGGDFVFWEWNVLDGKLEQSGRIGDIPEDEYVSTVELDLNVPEILCVAHTKTQNPTTTQYAIPLNGSTGETRRLHTDAQRLFSVIPTPKGPRLFTFFREENRWTISGVHDQSVDATFHDPMKPIRYLYYLGAKLSRKGDLAVIPNAQLLMVFDLKKGKLLNPDDGIPNQLHNVSFAWSNSSQFLATNYWRGFLTLFDLDTGREKWKIPKGDVHSEKISFTSNDEFIIVLNTTKAENGELEHQFQSYRSKDGTLVHQFHTKKLGMVTHFGVGNKLVASDDGRFVATTCRLHSDPKLKQKTIAVYDFVTGEEIGSDSAPAIHTNRIEADKAPREFWQSLMYDDFTFAQGTHKLILAALTRRNQEKRAKNSVIIFDADQPTEVEELILDPIKKDFPLVTFDERFGQMRFDKTGTKLFTVITAFNLQSYSVWQFESAQLTGFERFPIVGDQFRIEEVMNDSVFRSQKSSRSPENGRTTIQFRRLADGSIAQEIEWDQSYGYLPGSFSNGLPSIAPNGNQILGLTSTGTLQILDISK